MIKEVGERRGGKVYIPGNSSNVPSVGVDGAEVADDVEADVQPQEHEEASHLHKVHSQARERMRNANQNLQQHLFYCIFILFFTR